ncbi:DUF2083 domain-containing protein [Rhodovulum sulfidophilum]|nr:short-chain fatty acyl-CoA regulator family protein [Rhodovulum sulfidophilum]MCE8438570.1 DUF2083 domain-containing protein [Rhodovulum sulfidophilum]MCE8455337.1 DUF2083 domain-containing protein [Rhodovulum sulfidophilum]
MCQRDLRQEKKDEGNGQSHGAPLEGPAGLLKPRFREPGADGRNPATAGPAGSSLAITLPHPASKALRGARIWSAQPDLATPIGVGCKICDRRASPRRAFPMTGRPVRPDPGVSRLAPYSGA